MDLNSWLPKVCKISVEAGDLIEKIYHDSEPTEIEKKSDGTPVTIADKQADDLICKALALLTPNIPLVTEESVGTVPFETRQAWSTFWLVDPLDGTKEFIERTGEFSVNIGLVQDGKVVLGVVYVPLTRVLYCAVSGQGAYRFVIPKQTIEADWQDCLNPYYRVQTRAMNRRSVTKVAVSRRHGTKVTNFIEQLGDVELVYMGSAIKSCLVAEGKADVYPRFGPTSLWDTAAAQCVVEEAGGAIVDENGQALRYVQSESLLNPYFMVIGDCQYSWPSFPSL